MMASAEKARNEMMASAETARNEMLKEMMDSIEKTTMNFSSSSSRKK
jgi:hypothetical protein